MTTLQVAAFILSLVSALALAVWALSNKIAAGNSAISREVAALREQVAVANQASKDRDRKIDEVIVPELKEHDKRLRAVEFGSALSELLEFVESARKGASA